MLSSWQWRAVESRALNQLFSTHVPGILGVESRRESLLIVLWVTWTSTPPLIAGTGYLFAPAVIALADTLAAIGVGQEQAK